MAQQSRRCVRVIVLWHCPIAHHSQRHQRPGKPLAEKSSIASMLADAFVTSRLTVAFILACILIGSWALLITPRQDNPRIVVPAASITVDFQCDASGGRGAGDSSAGGGHQAGTRC